MNPFARPARTRLARQQPISRAVRDENPSWSVTPRPGKTSSAGPMLTARNSPPGGRGEAGPSGAEPSLIATHRMLRLADPSHRKISERKNNMST